MGGKPDKEAEKSDEDSKTIVEEEEEASQVLDEEENQIANKELAELTLEAEKLCKRLSLKKSRVLPSEKNPVYVRLKKTKIKLAEMRITAEEQQNSLDDGEAKVRDLCRAGEPNWNPSEFLPDETELKEEPYFLLIQYTAFAAGRLEVLNVELDECNKLYRDALGLCSTLGDDPQKAIPTRNRSQVPGWRGPDHDIEFKSLLKAFKNEFYIDPELAKKKQKEDKKKKKGHDYDPDWEADEGKGGDKKIKKQNKGSKKEAKGGKSTLQTKERGAFIAGKVIKLLG
jgi:hypothetical protein